jgi:hypothetical protein
MGLSIIGKYEEKGEEYRAYHVINEQTWTIECNGEKPLVFNLLRIEEPSEENNYVGLILAQNDSQNQFNPNLYSKFNFMYYEDSLWYCQIAFDTESKGDAASRECADKTAPETGGCGKFRWSKLVPLG